MASRREKRTNRVLIGVGIVIALLVIGGFAYSIMSNGDEGPSDESDIEDEDFKAYTAFPNTPVTDLDTANNEPTIAINPNDPMNIVAGSNDYGTPTGDAWVGYYYSFDGGDSWGRGLIPGGEGERSSPLWRFAGGGDPVLAFAPDGTCYMAGIVFQRDPALGNILKPGSGIFVARSDDGGRTFPMVSLVISSISNYITFHDKEWIAVDPTTGDVHVTWTAFQLYGVSSAMAHSVSRDRGETWSRPQIISEISRKERQVQGSQVEVTNDGVVHVSWIEYDIGSLRYTRSTDGGSSFDTVRTIASVTPLSYYLPNGDYRTPTMCDMAVDNTGGERDGSVYLAWPDQRNGEGQSDIYIVSSSNGGDTWLAPIKVNNAVDVLDNDQFFPAVAVGNDGSVQVMFYDRRDDPENNLISVYFAISRDGGMTWDNIRMQDEPFDGDNSGGKSAGPFIGDYLGLASGPGWTVGVWCDAREGRPEAKRTDIWMGKVIYSEEGEK